MKVRSFTTQLEGLSLELINKVTIRNILSGLPLDEHIYYAIWDTGANTTAITRKVVEECGLIAIGRREVVGVHKSSILNTYLIEIQLSDEVVVSDLQVVEANFASDNAHVLIGMDIIGRGDFAVSNYKGRTSFTFRIPSTETLDFTQ